MTITTELAEDAAAHNLLILKEDAVKNVAQAAILNMLECHIDMICDDPASRTKSRDELQYELNQWIKESSAQYISDVLDDFKLAVLNSVRNMPVSMLVRGVSYTAEGLIDDVDVECQWL